MPFFEYTPPESFKWTFFCLFSQRENKIFHHDNYPFDQTRKLRSVRPSIAVRAKRAEKKEGTRKEKKFHLERKIKFLSWWLLDSVCFSCIQIFVSTLIRSEFIFTCLSIQLIERRNKYEFQKIADISTPILVISLHIFHTNG